MIISHHVTKSSAREGGPPALEDLSGAGLAESAGNWWLLGRNEPYRFDKKHDLSVVYGGRDEQAGLMRIVFNEEDWTFEITSGQDLKDLKDLKDQKKREAEERRQQDKQTKINEARSSVKHALANEKDAKPKSWIEERLGLPQSITRTAIAELLNNGTLVNQPYKDARGRTQRSGLILKKMATQPAPVLEPRDGQPALDK